MKKRWLFLASGLIVAAGLPYRCDWTEYVIRTEKIKSPVRLVMLSDLHGTSYGKNMQKLVNMIEKAKADAVLIPGDLFDEFHQDDNGLTLLKQIKIPVYFSTGNHEEHRNDLKELLAKIDNCGIRILDGNTHVIQIRDNIIEIGGIACRKHQRNYHPNEVRAMYHTDYYRILLSHRPHWVQLYQYLQCDLILSGHAHGGQWCFPFTKQGVAAPQQGLFPKYTTGMHELNHQKLIIGRGLTRDYHGIPRLYNNPEFIVIELLPR